MTDGVLAAPGLAGIADRWGSPATSCSSSASKIRKAPRPPATRYIKSLVERYVGTWYGWMSAQAVSADDVRDIMVAYVQNPRRCGHGHARDSGCINIDEMPMEEEERQQHAV